MHPANHRAINRWGPARLASFGVGSAESSSLVVVSTHLGGCMGSTGCMGSYVVDHSLNLWNHVT